MPTEDSLKLERVVTKVDHISTSLDSYISEHRLTHASDREYYTAIMEGTQAQLDTKFDATVGAFRKEQNTTRWAIGVLLTLFLAPLTITVILDIIAKGIGH